MGIGVDQAQPPHKIKVTVQAANTAALQSLQKGAATPTTKAFWNIENNGGEIFDTLEGVGFKAGRRLYYPHNEVVIFGADLCRQGIKSYLDFFLRYPQIRPTVWILTAQGDAAAILNSIPKTEKIPVNYITNLLDTRQKSPEIHPVNLHQFISGMIGKSAATSCPLIAVSKDKKLLILTGTAIFKKDRLVGMLNRVESRGLSWVAGEVNNGVIEIKLSDGKIALDILRANSKVTPEIKNGRLRFKVKIIEESGIVNITGKENPFDPRTLAVMEKKQADWIKKDIQLTLKKARELRTDFLGFGNILYRTHPRQWRKLASHWDEVFAKLEVDITVEAKIRRSGVIIKPAIP